MVRVFIRIYVSGNYLMGAICTHCKMLSYICTESNTNHFTDPAGRQPKQTMSNTTITMFTCTGYQNVRDYSERDIVFPIHTAEIPIEHGHAVITYTGARNESLEQLLQELKQAAGVESLRYELVD